MNCSLKKKRNSTYISFMKTERPNELLNLDQNYFNGEVKTKKYV